MKYANLPLSKIGQSTELADDYLELTGDDEPFLCVSLIIAKTPHDKVLAYHFALFCPEFGDMKFLDFDVRELLPNIELCPPLKAKDKLDWIASLLAEKFGSTKEIIEAVLVSKSEPITV